MSSQEAKELMAIEAACQPGEPRVWNPTAEVRVSRLGDGNVSVEVADRNRAVYNSTLARLQTMVRAKVIRGLKSANWTFTFKPVR